MYKVNIIEEKEGEETKKELFKIVEAIDENGNPVNIQQSIGIFVLSNLESKVSELRTQLATVTSKLEAEIADLESQILIFNQ